MKPSPRRAAALVWTVFAVALAAACGEDAELATPGIAVRGTVRDCSSGAPIESAGVWIGLMPAAGRTFNEIFWAGVTSDSGRFVYLQTGALARDAAVVMAMTGYVPDTIRFPEGAPPTTDIVLDTCLAPLP